MELLERERCLADLANWLSDAPLRGGSVALVSGEAGIGKTALLHQFSHQQRQVRVLWGACDDLFTPRPLAPLHDIAQQSQGALLAAVSSGANREELFTAALCELKREPALVVFEDMHWADEATLDLLKYLGRRVAQTRALIAVTYRDDEVGSRHPLRFVIGDLPRATTRKMPLSTLSEAAVAHLAKSTGHAAKGIYEITGGNPLFVTEVLAAGTDTVPATVRDAVLARAVKLSPAAREIAELVCVVPGKADAWLLEQTVRPDATGIDSCLSIGMVSSEDGSLAYRHELVRRAFEGSLPQPRKRELHAKVLTVLAALPGVPPARLAHHASSARDSDAVMRFAPLAAAQATSVGAHREAAAHFETMLPFAADLAPTDRARLLEQLSYECFLTGRYGRASEARREALKVWRGLAAPMQEGETLCWLSQLAWFDGRRQEADRYSGDAIRVLESLPPGPELAAAYCDRAGLDMESHQNDSAIAYAQRAIVLAEACSNDRIISESLNALGTARLIVGDDSGWPDLERSLRLALSGGFHQQVASAYTALSAMAVSRRQYGRAASYLSAGLAYAEERDLDFLRPYMLAYRARMRLEQGDWLGAGEDAGAVLLYPQTTPVARLPALRILAHLRIRRGDPEASVPLEEARTLAGPEPELQQFGTLAAIRAEAAWLAGDYEGVIREAQAAYERVCRQRDPRMKGELAAWLWRVNALDGGQTEIAEPYGMEISGNWRGAAQAWQAFGCPYERALVLGWHGGELEQREALEIFERLGAAPAAQALRKQMRATGVRGVPRGARTSTRTNPYGLTQREAEILSLMTNGLRNAAIAKRLHVSTRTVDHHVSAILTKLGAQSRAEAIAVAHRSAGHAV
jgi:DNA-binding CsgD family transcriptional regulator